MDMKGKKVIFFIGPPGAGKDTQTNLLEEKTGFYKFITGDEGLKYISEHMGDPLTAKQKENYDSGEVYDPQWLIDKVQKEKAKEILESGHKGIIFAGSPRTLYEAERLPKILGNIIGDENVITVIIEADEKNLRERAKDRLVCDKDENHTFSTRLDGVNLGDSCPDCDGHLERKPLDKKLDERLRKYKSKTVPGLEYLKKHGKVAVIDGNPAPDIVEKNIDEALKKKGFLWFQ